MPPFLVFLNIKTKKKKKGKERERSGYWRDDGSTKVGDTNSYQKLFI